MNRMMNLRWNIAIVASAVFCLAVAAHAHEGHHHTALGTVRAIDAVKLELETQEGKLESFVLAEETSYKRGDAVATHEDVEVGFRAAVMYEAKDGKNVAIEVKLGAKK